MRWSKQIRWYTSKPSSNPSHMVSPPTPMNSIAALYPFRDNGVIRIGGRLAHGYSMTDDQRFLLLVSHRSKLATHAMSDAHKQTLHGGLTATVAEMRRRMWVTQARRRQSASRNASRACASTQGLRISSWVTCPSVASRLPNVLSPV